MYTALAWRNKAFGSGLEFVWSADSNDYAIRETNSRIKIYKNFQVGATIFSCCGAVPRATVGFHLTPET